MSDSNYMSIDYGLKRIGLAYSVKGIISTLPVLPNDAQLIERIIKISQDLNISKVYVGVSEGRVAHLTLNFVSKLKRMLKLPVETVEEAVSTIEAVDIIKKNRQARRLQKNTVDSVAAAVILRRVIS